jgi:hypothetical protein
MDQIPHGILSLNMVDHWAWHKTSSTLPTQLLQTPTLETQSHGTITETSFPWKPM